ncbi:hypothetical protein ACULLL_10020 [Lysinibacillus irui]|uniref:hypothetical protein n=1 Tax=Lysinibacillus irui TaxID=2998077 RepID=UPI0040450C37
MARMREIGVSFDKGYRDDLNYNFGLLEALIGEANGLTDNLREEMLGMINNLQQQIDMLTGENIGELLERLNDSIQQALTAAQDARTAKTATEEATALATTATELANAGALLTEEKANYANEKAVLAQEAADNANLEASNLSQLKIDVVQATQEANTATGNAKQATQDAQTATNAINVVLPNVTGLVNLKEWNIETQYQMNNFVTLEGNGYMALRDNKGVRPPSLPLLSNADWAMFVQKGEKGEQGTGVRILGTLPDEGSLPPTGEPGDAYLINGDLYVWSDTTNDWTNVGTIKGPKGDTGPQGPEGPQGLPGKEADLTEINQKVGNLQTEVTGHIKEMATTEIAGHVMLVNELTTGGVDKAASAETVKTLKSQLDTHGNDNNKHLVNGERTTWNNKLPTFATPWKEGLDPNTHTDTFYVSDHPNLGGGYWYVENRWYGDKSNGILMQVATSYTGEPDQKVRRKGQDGSWTAWSPSFQSLKRSVSDGKVAVNQAVTDMGVYTAPDATFATTAANIRQIGGKAAKGFTQIFSNKLTVNSLGFTPKYVFGKLSQTSSFFGDFTAINEVDLGAGSAGNKQLNLFVISAGAWQAIAVTFAPVSGGFTLTFETPHNLNNNHAWWVAEG